jgi:hypothetical protein
MIIEYEFRGYANSMDEVPEGADVLGVYEDCEVGEQLVQAEGVCCICNELIHVGEDYDQTDEGETWHEHCINNLLYC